jgi:K+-transporting ATPase KdpF subunit
LFIPAAANVSEEANPKEKSMLENAVFLLLIATLLVYLVYALLRPEKF